MSQQILYPITETVDVNGEDVVTLVGTVVLATPADGSGPTYIRRHNRQTRVNYLWNAPVLDLDPDNPPAEDDVRWEEEV